MGNPLPLHPGAKPCVQCGYCCRKVPCPYGRRVSDTVPRCVHLTEENACSIYEWILARPEEEWYCAPAFGAGCCSDLNSDRLLKLYGKRRS